MLEEFESAWWAFVRRWDDARRQDEASNGKASDLLLDDLLSEGLTTSVSEPVPRPLPATCLACEVTLIKRSGFLDEAAYRSAFAEAQAATEDPAQHFCETGWRSLANPRPDFDLWWYWVEYLDPRAEVVNPVVHYLLVGRSKGNATQPPEVPEREPVTIAGDRPVRRVCLFAGYDPDGIVDDYVVDYISELARHADVYYLADCTMSLQELAKLEPYVRRAWSIRHGLYDFGSWSMMARDLVGWDVLTDYDEVLLVNDSAYLLRPLDNMLAQMDGTVCDWWGMHPTQRSYAVDCGNTQPMPAPEAIARWSRTNDVNPLDHLHLSSYFIALRRPVIDDPGFRRRLGAVARQGAKIRVILKYEIGLSRYLFTNGFVAGTVIDQLYPFMPIYSQDYWTLVERGFPFLKRNLLTDNPRRQPELAEWKQRISAVVPTAKVDEFESNLIRVTSDDQRHRNFAIRSREDGTVDYNTPLTWERFRLEDRWAPKFDHWWAFPVCAFDHTIAGNERAVFEEVKDDPSIKKIILTRSRPLEVTGENVEVVPLVSREGQHFLTRSRQIFVKHGPKLNAHWPLSPLTHNFVNLWHGIPLKRFGSASVEISPALEKVLRRDNGGCRAVVTSSKIDTLSMATAFWPLSYPDLWNTGLPRNDYITCRESRLPSDLREQERSLREEAAGRRVVMFLPTYKVNQLDAYYQFTDTELAELAAWLDANNAVLGVREHMADRAHAYWHQLAPLGSIDLSSRRFPDLEVLYRVADCLVSDYSSCMVDFQLTGRPVVSFAYDLERYSQQERGLFYDLTKVLPGPVCQTFADLIAALGQALDPKSADEMDDYRWRREIFFDHVDDQASRRVVNRVKGLYLNSATASA